MKCAKLENILPTKREKLLVGNFSPTQITVQIVKCESTVRIKMEDRPVFVDIWVPSLCDAVHS